MNGAVATSREERPVYFPAGDATLFGVFTEPTVQPLGTAVIVLPGAGFASMVNRNRLGVKLCRRLAAIGYHTLRLDYHGVGDSTGRGDAHIMDHPFTSDVEGAIRWISEQGVSRFVLLGTCFGAWNALISGAVYPEVVGTILVSLPFNEEEKAMRPWVSRKTIGWRLKGLFEARRRRVYVSRIKVRIRALSSRAWAKASRRGREQELWVRPETLESFAALARRKVPILLAYGTADKEYRHFGQARPGRLDQILEEAGSIVEHALLEGQVHGLADLHLQTELTDLTIDWLTRHRVGFAAQAVGISIE